MTKESWILVTRRSRLPSTDLRRDGDWRHDPVVPHAKHTLVSQFIPGGYRRNDPEEKPAGIEIGFVTDDVPAAWDTALAAGAMDVAAPATKPWGQTVAYVRDPEGMLVELCTPEAAETGCVTRHAATGKFPPRRQVFEMNRNRRKGDEPIRLSADR